MPDTRTQHELAEIKHIHERYELDYRAYVLKLARAGGERRSVKK